MAQPYPLSLINSDCLNFIQAIGLYSPSFKLFYEVVHATGCRFEELTDISRFQMDGEERIIFQPGKGNNERILYVADLPEKFVTMVETQESYFDRVDYDTNRRYFRAHYPRPVYLNSGGFLGKRVGIYIFRYRMFKQLYADGVSPGDIGIIMGEVDLKNVNGYIDADLIYN